MLHKQSVGMIHLLRAQVPFKLYSKAGVHVTTYYADYTYIEKGLFVVEDAKGKLTDVFKIKLAWFEADYGMKLRLTFKNDPSTW